MAQSNLDTEDWVLLDRAAAGVKVTRSDLRRWVQVADPAARVLVRNTDLPRQSATKRTARAQWRPRKRKWRPYPGQ